MRIPDRHFTGHYSQIRTRMVVHVNKRGRFNMTQERFQSMLDKWESKEQVRYCRSIDTWYREMGL